MRDQEKHIEQLRAAVRNKGQPLKIAQARLAMRTKLPGDEACLDLPHIMLLEEVGQIEVKSQNTGLFAFELLPFRRVLPH